MTATLLSISGRAGATQVWLSGRLSRPGKPLVKSSFMIVPVALSRASTALSGDESLAVSVSLISTSVSPKISTSAVWVLSPLANCRLKVAS